MLSLNSTIETFERRSLEDRLFQSPKSGKIELNSLKFITKLTMKF